MRNRHRHVATDRRSHPTDAGRSPAPGARDGRVRLPSLDAPPSGAVDREEARHGRR